MQWGIFGSFNNSNANARSCICSLVLHRTHLHKYQCSHPCCVVKPWKHFAQGNIIKHVQCVGLVQLQSISRAFFYTIRSSPDRVSCCFSATRRTFPSSQIMSPLWLPGSFAGLVTWFTRGSDHYYSSWAPFVKKHHLTKSTNNPKEPSFSASTHLSQQHCLPVHDSCSNTVPILPCCLKMTETHV